MFNSSVLRVPFDVGLELRLIVEGSIAIERLASFANVLILSSALESLGISIKEPNAIKTLSIVDLRWECLLIFSPVVLLSFTFLLFFNSIISFSNILISISKKFFSTILDLLIPLAIKASLSLISLFSFISLLLINCFFL